MPFKDEKDTLDFLNERRQASSATRRHVANTNAICNCYVQGLQWISRSVFRDLGVHGTERRLTDWNPDSTSMRATVNRITKHVVKAAAATFVSKIEVEVTPPDSDTGLDSSFAAQTIENLCANVIRSAGMVAQARDAQFYRCVTGAHGLGMYIQEGTRAVDGQEVPDKQVRCFSFDPIRLMLDPANTSRRLSDHDEVVYEDAWPIQKIRRVFGDKIAAWLEEQSLSTIGQLMNFEIQMNALSGGQLYSDYARHSNTKGAMVSQIHCRGPSGRHDLMYVCVRPSKEGIKCVNIDDPRSPFGGCGLPLFLLHGHRRPMSPWSVGDVSMMKDDQDFLNSLRTMYMRMLQTNGGQFWTVDKRHFPDKTTDQEIRSKFSNRINNVVVMQSRAERGVPDPKLHVYPPPPQFLMEDYRAGESDMREQVALSALNYGQVKTHVADETNRRALEESGQVLNIRVKEDAETYTECCGVLVGTELMLMREENPGTLVRLADDGFGPEEFEALLQTDPYSVARLVTVRDSSARQRSLESKTMALNNAAALKQITPTEYRRELAALDIPLTSDDATINAELTKRVDQLLNGKPWRPLPLRAANEICLSLLERALFDPRAKNNPQVEQAVIEATVAQMQAQAAVMALMAGPQATTGGGQEGGLDDGQGSDTLGSVLNELAGVGPGSSPQPVAA